MIVLVTDLVEGDLVDLEEIVDALGFCDLGECPECDGHRISIECEYATVEGWETEADECVRLDTNHGSYGLPPTQLIKRVYHAAEVAPDGDAGDTEGVAPYVTPQECAHDDDERCSYCCPCAECAEIRRSEG